MTLQRRVTKLWGKQSIPTMSYNKHNIDDAIKYIILGGGGHAEMILEALSANNITEQIGILDNNPNLWNTFINGIPILGSDELLSDLADNGATYFISAVGGTYDNKPRQILFEKGETHGLTPFTLIHPTAIVAASSDIGLGSVVLPGAIINGRCIIGSNVIINTGVILEHGCEIGNHVHIASGSTICGDVKISDYAHVGAGSTIIQNISIGEKSIVGAGAVVIEDVLPKTVVAGVPSKVIRMIHKADR